MKHFDKTKIKALIKPVIYFSLALVIGVSFTSAWIKREWSPSISGTDMKIQSEGSLAFWLGNGSSSGGVSGGGSSTSIDLSTRFQKDDMGNLFTFKPVSNLTGESDDFYAIRADYTSWDDVYFERFSYKDDGYGNNSIKDFETLSRGKGYIEFNFQLYSESSSEDMVKYIYLTDCFIEPANADMDKDQAKAFRVSISYSSSASQGQTNTVILRNKCEEDDEEFADARCDEEAFYQVLDSDGKVDPNWKQAYVIDHSAIDAEGYHYVQDPETGKPVIGEDGSKTINNSIRAENEYPRLVKPFEHYYDPHNYTINPSPKADLSDKYIPYFVDDQSGSVSDIEKRRYLFTIRSTAERYYTTVRIWLEGEDPHCTESILGSAVNLKITFTALDVSTSEEGESTSSTT